MYIIYIYIYRTMRDVYIEDITSPLTEFAVWNNLLGFLIGLGINEIQKVYYEQYFNLIKRNIN